MDGSRFDAIARLATSPKSRRTMISTALIGIGLPLAGIATGGESLARKRCKKRGELCTGSKQCCDKGDGVKCKVPHGAGNSDTTCCGVTGGVCGGIDGVGDAKKPFCCVGWECNSKNGKPGKCVRRREEL